MASTDAEWSLGTRLSVENLFMNFSFLSVFEFSARVCLLAVCFPTGVSYSSDIQDV